MAGRRPERGSGPESSSQGGIHPRYRRAFGCVTWVNMAVLVFLLVAFLLVLPFRYAGDGQVYTATLLGLAFVGIVLILPGMAAGAILGARSYRVENRLGLRAGAGIGATAGLSGYLFFSLVEGLPLLAIPPAVSLGLLLYALFASGQGMRRRRAAVLVAAALSLVSGATAFTLDFDPLALLSTLVATASAAVGGFVGGFGYARAGGDERLPPGSTIRPREPRRKPR